MAATDQPSPDSVPDSVQRAMLWAPIYSLLPFCILVIAWLMLVWGPMSIADLAGITLVALAAYAFLAFVCMGIAGSLGYRFLSGRQAFTVVPTVSLAAIVGGVATVPFLSMWDMGIWIIGVLTGAMIGLSFFVLARRFSVS